MDRPQETARLAQDSEQMDVVSPSGVTDGALKCGNCSCFKSHKFQREFSRLPLSFQLLLECGRTGQNVSPMHQHHKHRPTGDQKRSKTKLSISK